MGAGASIPTTVNDEQFKNLVQDLYTPGLFFNLSDSATQTINQETLVKFLNSINDVFLTHDWGTDENGRDNHQRVLRVYKALKAKGIKCWFDETEMEGRIQQKMSEGIDSSRVVLVFVTKRYIDKVAGKGALGDGDNCLYEFDYANQKKPGKRIAVVMEERCSNSNNWYGPVGGLGSKLYQPFWDDDQFDTNLESLYKMILKMIKKPIQQIMSESSDSTAQASTPNDGRDNLILKTFQDWFVNEANLSAASATKYSSKLLNDGITSVDELATYLRNSQISLKEDLEMSKFDIIKVEEKLLKSKTGTTSTSVTETVKAPPPTVKPIVAATSNKLIFMAPCPGYNVRVRLQPSFDSAQVGLLPNGYTFKFTRIEGMWAKLAVEEYDGLKSRGDNFVPHDPTTEGWCAIKSNSGDSLLSQVSSTPTFYMTPNPEYNLRVRREKSFDSDQIGLIPSTGVKYQFTRIEGNWAKVAVEEYEGLKSRSDFVPHDPEKDGWCAIKSKDGTLTLLS